jgi:NADPH-dependent 7-cyano-7-deazaguanine reductase QueF-like protein
MCFVCPSVCVKHFHSSCTRANIYVAQSIRMFITYFNKIIFDAFQENRNDLLVSSYLSVCMNAKVPNYRTNFDKDIRIGLHTFQRLCRITLG